MFCLCVSVCKGTTMQRYNIFLYYNTFLNFFSLIIHKLRFLYHISENEQKQDKIGTYTAPAPVPIYSENRNPVPSARNPKTYKLLYKNGLVLKGINFCTYQEGRARDSEKAHKKVQKRKNRRKGVFWGANFQKVKSIGRESPLQFQAYFG